MEAPGTLDGGAWQPVLTSQHTDPFFTIHPFFKPFVLSRIIIIIIVIVFHLFTILDIPAGALCRQWAVPALADHRYGAARPERPQIEGKQLMRGGTNPINGKLRGKLSTEESEQREREREFEILATHPFTRGWALLTEGKGDQRGARSIALDAVALCSRASLGTHSHLLLPFSRKGVLLNYFLRNGGLAL